LLSPIQIKDVPEFESGKIIKQELINVNPKIATEQPTVVLEPIVITKFKPTTDYN